jgi:hypothetical protein
VVIAGCSSLAPPRHESQQAAGVDLTTYRSFAWNLPAADGNGGEPLRLLDTNIRGAVQAELTRRGYEYRESGAADLVIDYETTTAERVRSNPVRLGIGIGSFGSNVGGSVSMGSPSVQSYQEGRLVIHVVDAAKRAEVWSGTIAGRVDRTTLDAAAVGRVVALALEDFPARTVAPAP